MNYREAFIKKFLTQEEINTLILKARESINTVTNIHFEMPVGACILTKSGKYYTGCNIELSRLSPSLHAEQCAIVNAIVNGSKDFKALALYSKSKDNDLFITLCGSCREFLNNHCSFLPIILVHKTGALMYEILHELLPLSLRSHDHRVETLQTTSYEQAIINGNKWMLRDIYHRTRDEMRRLLIEWEFDEIIDRFKEKLTFKSQGIIKSIFQTGSTYLNFISWQDICQSFVEYVLYKYVNTSLPLVVIAFDHGGYCKKLGDQLAALLKINKFSIFKEKPIYSTSLITKTKIEDIKDNDYVIFISEIHGNGETTITFMNGNMHLIDEDDQKEISEKIKEDKGLVDLSEYYDYNTLEFKLKSGDIDKTEYDLDIIKMENISNVDNKGDADLLGGIGYLKL